MPVAYTIRRAISAFAAALSLTSLIACKPNRSITLEATIEEPPRLSSSVEMGDARTTGQLIAGFHRVEENSWRWTAGHFAVRLGLPPGASHNGVWVVMKFNVPEVLLERYQAITLSAQLNHLALASETYTRSGSYEYRHEAFVPPQIDSVEVDFSLDKYLASGVVEARELGLVVSSIALEPK